MSGVETTDESLIVLGRKLGSIPATDDVAIGRRQRVIEKIAATPARSPAGLLIHATLLAELVGCDDERGGIVHELVRRILSTAQRLAAVLDSTPLG